jgi:hypothetical protein
VATAVALAGCNGEDGGAAFPCSLLDRDEVKRALGAPVADGDASENGGIEFCSWAVEGGGGRVRLGVLDVPDADELFDLATNTEPIDDLGDRAQVGPAGNVTVAVGNRILQFDVLDSERPADEVGEIGEELARKAVPRL